MDISTTTCSYSDPVVLANGELFVPDNTVTGVPFQFLKMNCTTTKESALITSSTATSTPPDVPAVLFGFTYGEILTNFFLLYMFVFGIYIFLHVVIKGIKIKP